MTLKQKITIHLICTLCSCKHGQIIGKWQRVKPDLEKAKIKISKDFGDMSINSDSTFYVQGDSINQTSTTPGWHVGGDYYGKWEYSKSGYLLLTVANGDSPFPYSYKIIRLTKKKLILLPAFSTKRNKPGDLKYLRR